MIYAIYVSLPMRSFERIKYLIRNVTDFRSSNGKMVGLYAFSKKKSIAKEFMEIRNSNIMTLKKIDADDDWSSEFKSRFSSCCISEYTLSTGDKKKPITLLCTKNEYSNIHDFKQENLFEFGPAQFTKIDYEIFNDDVIEALDILGYTTAFDTSNDDMHRIAIADEQRGHGKTVMGHTLYDVTNFSEYAALLCLYSDIFFDFDE